MQIALLILRVIVYRIQTIRAAVVVLGIIAYIAFLLFFFGMYTDPGMPEDVVTAYQYSSASP